MSSVGIVLDFNFEYAYYECPFKLGDSQGKTGKLTKAWFQNNLSRNESAFITISSLPNGIEHGVYHHVSSTFCRRTNC